MKLTTTMAIAMFASATAFASDKVPRAVTDAFTKAYPSVAKISWEMERGNYEGKFKHNNKDLTVIYKTNGYLVETEELIRESEIPKMVTTEAHKMHPKASFSEYAKITRPDGSVVYEVEIRENGKAVDLIYTPEGRETK